MLARPIALDGHRVTVRFLALFVDGDADRAAIEDGVLAPGGTLPNPFYLRDLGREATLRVAQHVTAAILAEDQGGTLAPRAASRKHLMDALRSCTRTDACGVFWITATDGRVRVIVEEYIP